jgi:hypothetical protein
MQYRKDDMEIEDRVLYAQDVLSEHHLMNSLVSLPKLQSLKLEFGECEPSTARLSDIFSESHTWPDLRKMTRVCFATEPEDLLSLLDRHHSTSKVLRLHEAWFETPLDTLMRELDPPEVLATIHKTLRLERAKLSGCFGHANQLYDLDDANLAHAITENLIHSGTCPLNGINGRESWDLIR